MKRKFIQLINRRYETHQPECNKAYSQNNDICIQFRFIPGHMIKPENEWEQCRKGHEVSQLNTIDQIKQTNGCPCYQRDYVSSHKEYYTHKQYADSCFHIKFFCWIEQCECTQEEKIHQIKVDVLEQEILEQKMLIEIIQNVTYLNHRSFIMSNHIVNLLCRINICNNIVIHPES